MATEKRTWCYKAAVSLSVVLVMPVVMLAMPVRAEDEERGKLPPVEVTEEVVIKGEIWQPSKHALFVQGSEKVIDARSREAFQRNDADPVAKGQYRIDSAGTFHFHAQDKGRKVKVTYSYAPIAVIIHVFNETGFPASLDDIGKVLRGELQERGYIPVPRERVQATALEIQAEARKDSALDERLKRMTVLEMSQELCKRVNAKMAIFVSIMAQSNSQYRGNIVVQNNQSSSQGFGYLNGNYFNYYGNNRGSGVATSVPVYVTEARVGVAVALVDTDMGKIVGSGAGAGERTLRWRWQSVRREFSKSLDRAFEQALSSALGDISAKK